MILPVLLELYEWFGRQDIGKMMRRQNHRARLRPQPSYDKR
jgi:hypothetical protein